MAFVAVASGDTYPNATPITINDCCASQAAATYPAPVTVSGLTGSITKVTATLTGLTHTASSDLEVLLVAPGGQKVMLMSDSGLSAAGVNLTFDDTVGPSLPTSATPLSSGTFKPTNGPEDCPGGSDVLPPPAPAAPYGTMADFNVATASTENGAWSFYIADDCEVDGGSLSGGVSLTITTTGTGGTFASAAAVTITDCCPATKVTPAYPSTVTVSGLSTITGVTVTLNGLTHGRTADLQALLVGPTGQTALLMSDTGGAAAGANVTFAEAGPSLPATGAVTTGTYIPTDRAPACAGPTDPPFPGAAPNGPYGTTLSGFNGLDPNGTWSLYLVDACAVDSGSVAQGWTLNIAHQPTAVTLTGFSATRTSKGVLLRWRTGQETSVLGFDLKRGAKKVNALIRAKGPGRARGASYSYLDRTAKRGQAYTYRLRAIGMDGRGHAAATARVKAR